MSLGSNLVLRVTVALNLWLFFFFFLCFNFNRHGDRRLSVFLGTWISPKLASCESLLPFLFSLVIIMMVNWWCSCYGCSSNQLLLLMNVWLGSTKLIRQIQIIANKFKILFLLLWVEQNGFYLLDWFISDQFLYYWNNQSGFELWSFCLG